MSATITVASRTSTSVNAGIRGRDKRPVQMCPAGRPGRPGWQRFRLRENDGMCLLMTDSP
ncbi:MAG: hypothetical protein AMXMBFR13_37500 [Phycisphaerae bacterium]